METSIVREFATATGPHRIDEERGILFDVLLCGNSSRNGYGYQSAGLKRAVDAGRYNDRPIFADHGDKPGQQRRIEHALGWTKEARHTPQGVRGNIHLLKSHPMTARIIEAATRNPRLFAFSHESRVAWDGPMRREAVDVLEVRSCDLVIGSGIGAATTNGLFESANRGKMMKSINQEQFSRLAFGTPSQVREAMDELGMAEEPPADELPAEEPPAEPSAAIAALADDVKAVALGDLDEPAKLARIKKLLAMIAQLKATAEESQRGTVPTTREQFVRLCFHRDDISRHPGYYRPGA